MGLLKKFAKTSLAGVFLPVVTVLAVTFLAGCDTGEESAFVSKGSEEHTKSMYKPPADEIVEDPATGLNVIKNVINITFRSGTAKEEIDRVASVVGGHIVGYDTAVNFYQLKIDGADLPAIEKLRLELMVGQKSVEMASLCTMSVKENPYYVK